MPWNSQGSIRGPQGEKGDRGPAGEGVGAAALGLMRISLSTRDVGPRVIVYTGSSTTEGDDATTEARRYVNILTASLQAVYPLRSGDPSPGMRTLPQAVAATLTAGVQGVNAGDGGTTASNYLTTSTIEDIASLDPSVIMHMVGSNDFASGVAPATYKTNLLNKVNALDAQITVPHIHIFVQPYQRMDVGSPAHPWADYGQAMREIAEASENTRVYIDLNPHYVLAGVPGADPYGLILADNIHQGDEGHAVMAELIRSEMGIRVAQEIIAASDTTPPSTPTGLIATPGDTQVSLTWTASTDNVGVTGYRVYRDTVLAGSPAGTSFVDTGRTNGVEYSYRVSAIDAALNESGQSSAATATPEASGDVTPPSTPTNLQATPGDTEVGLTWTASTDDVGVTGYRVYRDTVLAASPTGTSHTDTGRTNGIEYSYTVSAVDAALNESPQTAPVTATPTAATAVVEDHFTRADSTTTLGTAPTGQPWVAAVSTWGIDTNQAYNTSTSNGTALIDTGIADIDATLTITYNSGNSPGLVFRANSDNDRLSVILESTRVGIWRSGDGGPLSGSTGSFTRNTGTPYEVRLVAVGDALTVYIDDVQLVTYTLSPADLAAFTGTHVGLRGNSGTRFDDLVVSAA